MSTFYNKSCASTQSCASIQSCTNSLQGIQSCDSSLHDIAQDNLNSISTKVIPSEAIVTDGKTPRPIILVDEVSLGGTIEYHIIAPPSMRLVSDGFLYEPIDPKKESTDSWTTSAGLIWIVPVTEEDTIVTFRLGKHTVTYPLHSFLFAATSATSAPSISNGISNART